MENEYMAVVYQHPAFSVYTENNYMMVRLTEDVEFGELLLIEHAYAANTPTCHAVIENNEYLFNMYHPRTISYAETEQRYNLSKEKLSHNCFGLLNGDKIMTFMITKLNHSCNPNCAIYIQEKYHMENTNIIFMELFAIRSMKRGTELTINYGPDTAHNRDFVCGCEKTLDERRKLFKITSGIANSLSIKNNLLIRQMVYQYLEDSLSKKILLNHYLATKGIFMNNNTISAYTPEGVNTINDMIHKYLGLDNEIKIDEKIVEKTINSHKINLFMQIINDNLLN